MFQYPAKVLRIVDGDTLWLDIDLGFRMHCEVDVRLAHINTPETVQFRLDGLVDPALAYVMRVCPPGAIVVADVLKPEKYGRWLAVITYCLNETDRYRILRDPHVLNDELVREGLATKYEGGRK